MNDDDIKKKYGITDKQYKFANLVISGINPTEAYRRVYDTQASNNSISSQAGRALKNPKLVAYIKDMQRMAYEKARDNNENILSAEEIMIWWSSVITSTSRSIRMADKIKCSELLAKAQNMFIQKIEADVNSTNDIVINITNNEEENDEE